MTMARDDLAIIEISSSSSSEGEQEEQEFESSVQVTSTRNCNVPARKVKKEPKKDEEEECFILEVNPFEEEEDCIVLEVNPFEEEVINALTHLSRRLSLSSDHHFQEDILIIAERGQVACRDYPHPRHQCAMNPFDETPHEKYCQKCYCYVCDKAAPCEYWKEKSNGHCHASEEGSKWKRMRDAHRSNSAGKAVVS